MANIFHHLDFFVKLKLETQNPKSVISITSARLVQVWSELRSGQLLLVQRVFSLRWNVIYGGAFSKSSLLLNINRQKIYLVSEQCQTVGPARRRATAGGCLASRPRGTLPRYPSAASRARTSASSSTQSELFRNAAHIRHIMDFFFKIPFNPSCPGLPELGQTLGGGADMPYH